MNYFACGELAAKLPALTPTKVYAGNTHAGKTRIQLRIIPTKNAISGDIMIWKFFSAMSKIPIFMNVVIFYESVFYIYRSSYM